MPKGKVFQTAARLFYQHDYRAIGMDAIAAESGIGLAKDVDAKKPAAYLDEAARILIDAALE